MRLKNLPLLVLLFFAPPALFAGSERDSLVHELNAAIDNAKTYDAAKLEQIQNIKRSFEEPGKFPLALQYDIYQKLYEEYKIFKFDTAFIYASKQHEIARSLADPSKMAQSEVNLLFVFVSAGMYKEAAEIIKVINLHGQADSVKAGFYSIAARYYFDLADYVNDRTFTPGYNATGLSNLDSALAYYPAASFESYYYTGLKYLKSFNLEKANSAFRVLINLPGLTYHQQALVTSTLSGIYLRQGEKNTAINFQIRAAIADIKSSTKETFAIYNLSQLLFEQGDFENASFFIQKAIDDASFYGARQRKVQVSTILPIIQSSRINFIEGQKRSLLIYGAAVSAILILLCILIIIIYRQNRKLNLARIAISEAHAKLYAVNDKLSELNTQLYKVNGEQNELNSKLLEANKIKEEYVGYFFNSNSVLFHKIEKFKQSIEQKLDTRKLDEIRYIVNKIDIKDEKAELMRSFDKAFLKLFPHFVEEFNALLREDEKIIPADNEYLNTDLRIYALLRLGIKENEKIAEILEYSVKSIYAYKTRIRNKAIVPKDDFDRLVMDIKSV